MEEEIRMDVMGESRHLQIESSLKFDQHFWGEKNQGFEVLLQNLRNSQTAAKEFELFLRESTNSEDQYVKYLNKVTLQVQKFSNDSSLAPIWFNIIKEFNEHNSWSHLHFMHRIQELVKEVQSYHTFLRKKKREIKESEQKTQLQVETFKSIKSQMLKAKEQYYQLFFELKKQRELLEYNQQNTTIVQTTTPIHTLLNNIQRLEKKTQLAELDYKTIIEKYNIVREEFEERFAESCETFQTQEEAHLKQMRLFISKYMQLVNQINAAKQTNFNNFHQRLSRITNEMLLEQLIDSKSTGKEKPKPIEFFEPSSDINYFASKSNRHSIASSIQSRSFFLDYEQKKKSISMFSSTDTLSAPPPPTPDTNLSFLSSSVPNTDNMLNTKLNEKSTDITKGFSLFGFRGRNKLKKDYNSLPKKFKKPKNNEPTIATTSNQVKSILTDTFEKQLMQIEDLETLSKKRNISMGSEEKTLAETDNIESTFPFTQRDRFDSSFSAINTFDENNNEIFSTSPTNSFSYSIPINNRISTYEASNVAGSLITATSLDNSNFMKKSNKEYGGESEFFSDFEDINLDSIENYSKKIGEEKNMSVAVPESSESSEDKLSKKDDNSIDSNETESDSSDQSDDSDIPRKVILKIKPISEVDRSLAASPEVLRDYGKSLQLNLSNNYASTNTKKRQYTYSNQNTSISNTPDITLAQDAFNDSFSSLSSVTQQSMSPLPFSVMDNSRSISVFSLGAKTDENNNNVSSSSNFNQADFASVQYLSTSNGPPLPPLPIQIQEKYKQRLEINSNQSSSLNQHNQLKTQPISINISDNHLKSNEEITSRSSSPISIKSMLANMKIPGEDIMKF